MTAGFKEYRGWVMSVILGAALAMGCGRDEPSTVDTPFEAAADTSSVPTTGMIEVTGGRVWYKIYPGGDGIPLLALHGGPGMTSVYLTELKALAPERPVIIYDQLGCGKSDRPDDPTLWTVDRFVEELRQVREALGLEQVHLLGHSWGTMLAVEYMRSNPEGVVSLILASPAISVTRWLNDAKQLKDQLPDRYRLAIDRHEAAGTTDSPEYQEATMAFYRAYLNRQQPWRAEMDSMFQNMGVQVYNTMWGPSEFHATGVLKDFERSDILPSIQTPTLLTAGRFDEATPETVAWYTALMPNARLHVFENSAHMAMLEEPEAFVHVVGSFVTATEAEAGRGL